MSERAKALQKAASGVLGGALLFLGNSSTAWGCPVCNSGTGKAVRAGLFGQEFGFNLFVTVIPFVVCALIVAGIYYGPPGQRRARKEE